MRDSAARNAEALPERGPSSLLPPDPRLPARKAGPEVVAVSPGSLLPDARLPVRPVRPEIVARSPASLLPQVPGRPPAVDADETLPKVGPSSLLPEVPAGAWREPGPEIVTRSPSALLPQGPDARRPGFVPDPLPGKGPASLIAEAERRYPVEPAGPEVVAVSPSELLPPPPQPPAKLARRAAYAVGGLLAVALLALVSVVVVQRLGPDVNELLRNGYADIAAGDYTAAVRALREAVRKAPVRGEAHFALGTALLHLGDATGAEQELRRAVVLGFPAGRTTLALARAMLLQGKYEELLREFTVAGISRAQLPDMLTVIGSAHLGAGRSILARERFTQALEIDPRHAGASLGMARIALHSGNRAEATALVDKVLVRDAKNVEALVMQAELHLAAGDTERARKAYEGLLALSPNQIDALIGLAAIDIRARRFDSAESLLRAATKVHPWSAELANLYGVLRWRQGRLADARNQAQRALQALPSHLPSVLLAGAVELAANEHAEAQRRLAWVLQRNPFHLAARRLYAASLVRTGQPVRAIEMLEPVQAASDDAALLSVLGQAYAQAGEYANALAALEAAERHAARGAPDRRELRGPYPDHAARLVDEMLALDSKPAREIRHALELHTRGEGVAADRALAEALAKTPDDIRLLNLRAAFAIARKDFAAAQRDLQRALALDPEYVPAAVNMARIELVESTPRAARRRIESIHQRDPRNVDALLALARLGPGIEAAPEEIERWLFDALQADGKLVRPRVELGRHYLRRDEPVKALEQLNAAKSLRADNAEVLDGLALAHAALGQNAQAQAALAALATLRPDSATVFLRLGLAQLEGGRSAPAELALQRALELDPGLLDARIALARLDLGSGKVAAALDVARRLHEGSPTAVRQDHVDRTIELLRQAAAAGADRHAIRFELARLYLMKGDRQRARQELEQVVAAGKGFAQHAQAAALLSTLTP